MSGASGDVGIIVQGELYNTLMRGLELNGIADSLGNPDLPLYVLNVTYPLLDDEIVRFCAGNTAVLMMRLSLAISQTG
jgi:indolepyruvate ferredoxin oxidoreductase alpha subunit